VISIAIEPRSQAVKAKLEFSLEKMVEEDPTFRVRVDEDTGQTLISGMGELHLEVIVNRLRREYGVEAGVGRPQVVYRETVQATAEGLATFERELQDAELYGVARCRVRPLERGSGVRLGTALSGEPAAPPAIVAAARAGLAEATYSGPRGFPLQDVEATILEIGYREDAQPEIGVKVAAAEAFRRAVAAASPLRLEPVMEVEVTVPEDHVGPVIGDLKQRRALIRDIGTRGELRVIEVRASLRRMFGYSTDLRSLTKGRANFTMRFHAYDNLGAGDD